MQHKLINHLITHINCYPDLEKHKKISIDILHKHRYIKDTVLFLQAVHTDHNLFDSVFKALFMGLMAISDLEEKETSNNPRWIAIKRFEKDRKNIIPYINSLKDSLDIYMSLRDLTMFKRTRIDLATLIRT